MGKMVDIDFQFEHPIRASALLGAVAKSGMTLGLGGSVNFHLTDDFEWESRNFDDIENVLENIRRHHDHGETVGFSARFIDSEFGGSFLVPGNSRTVTFILDAERVLLGSGQIADFSWYLSRLAPAFLEIGLVGLECHEL
ncbi:hypothetical protein [Nocardia amikacinitolerans]|uniref:hypothetical protein n=1 Tax=Nocardia amikacinitolerans TaxID=756689 RepID=UPI0020A32759|nr:hypothetical protein [Nocardia amikacinitolerans]MCP2292232.1 hypothetical protein [Nocardia amikacinitolerans]